MNEASDSTSADTHKAPDPSLEEKASSAVDAPDQQAPERSAAGRSEAADRPTSRQTIKQREASSGRSYRFVVVAVLALLSLLAMAGLKSYRDLAAAQDIENNLQREIQETKVRVQALSEHIDRIDNDPAMLERLAREDLGMVREGDVVIVLPDEEPEH